MNLFKTIQEVFNPINQDQIAADKFSSCSIEYYISNFKNFNEEQIAHIIAIINLDDSFKLSLKIGENDELALKDRNLDAFIEQIIEERGEIEEESVYFKLEIYKETKQKISIYDFKSFDEFWNLSSPLVILELLKRFQNEKGFLVFSLKEKNIKSFHSQNIIFSANPTIGEANFNDSISENCHFGNIKEYPFNPYYFNLIQRPEIENAISRKLDRLCLIFCIIAIYDITAFNNSNLFYKINGYKSYEGEIDINHLNLSLRKIYFKIFDWIYSEKSKINDKIGICRNIISLSFKDKGILIDEKVFLSIQSTYKTYLKDNVSKYIDIRNKIIDELGWISQKSGEIVNNYLGNYQKSIFTFLSFFISVFLLRFLNNKNVEETFSKDVTIFSLAFLILSVFYLFFSIWNIHLEKDRLIRKYNNLKNRYSDLLEKHDIEDILKNDSEFNYELDFIDKRKCIYTWLWGITIAILISAILTVSSYLNWNTIFNLIF